MPNKNAAELDELYRAANQVDDKLFSEMRSNIKLVSGDHYNRQGSKFWNRIRSTKELTDNQKLRLTKNHIQNIVSKYTENILNDAANAKPFPNNEDEIQDQKTAELNDSVWSYYKHKLKFRKKVRSFAENFVQFGECYAKMYWDADKGEIIGYEQKLGEDGEPMYETKEHEQGYIEEPVADEMKPIYSGELAIEEVYGFNLLRDPSSQSMFDSPYFIVRKMVDKKTVKSMVSSEQDWKTITDSEEETYMVFDGDKHTYEYEKNNIMIREHYYKPCMTYPNGYFFIATRDVILSEGELPFGKWPFASAGFNKIPTSARYRSPIKQMRPYQVEINRSASAIATAQVTLGDDKLILPNGSKMSQAGKLPGVRAISVTGGDPKILGGRGGEQYLPYMLQQIKELYEVMNVFEADAVKDGQLDAYALLYHSSRNKRKFKKYMEEFEEFVCEVVNISLDLLRFYLEEYHVIPMIGKSEIVNIAEFKHSEPNKYRIRIEAVSDDTDTMLGKQLAINHTLQYVGKDLDKVEIGKLIRTMPFLNKEEAFSDLTVDYDMSKNDMLAMERGEMPIVNQYDNHTYLINRAVARVKKPDFRMLPPEVQGLYQQYIQMHEQAEMQRQMELQRMQQGLIPMDGALVTVDYYVTDSEGKTKRAKLPYGSLQWLEKQLAVQGANLQQLEQVNEGAVAEMAQMMRPMPPQY